MKRLCVAGGLLAALSLLATEARAQTGTARGKVLDQAGAPLEGAKVELDFLGGVTRHFETKTTKKGEFTQVGVAPGMYRFTISKEGYQGNQAEFRINLGDPTYVPDVKLSTKEAAQKAAAEKGGGAIQAGFDKALQLIRDGKPDEAEAVFKEILVKEPSIPEVHYNLGFLYSQKKDWAASEAAYQKALELRPEYSDAKVALARTYQDSGQTAKAVELMSGAASESDSKVQFSLGVMHLNAGKYDDAAAAFKRAETTDAANPEIQYYLGTIALGQNKSPEAIARLEKYLSMSPTNAQNIATAQALIQALKPKK